MPRLITRLDTTYGHTFGATLGEVPVQARGGLSFTYVPGRPLPYDEFGDPFYVLNASAQLTLWHAQVGLEARNLLDLQYRQSEFNYPSRFDRSRPLPTSGSPRPERHAVAGEPLTLMVTVTVALESLLGQLQDAPPSDPLLEEDTE